ncbi:MAG: NUDIX domain-containing protein [Clostridia bacterium]|nr:NUDIX domain-containing protein [Clostridia bacterium]
MKEIDKIAFIYLKNGKILSTLSKGKDAYYIPGGKREENETDEETLIRECKEELTIDIKKDTIKYYGTFEAQAHGKAEGILVKMTCYMADFEGKLEASSEIQEIKWLDYNDLDKISPVDKLIFKDLYKKNLLTGGVLDKLGEIENK